MKHLIALAIYLLLGLLFFNEIFYQTQWFGEDFFTQNFPNRHFAAVEIRNGSFPLWNPFVCSGMPFFADIQTGVLYPFNLLLSLFVKDNNLSYIIYEYQAVFHIVLGAFFMYLFVESLGLDFASALLGGILFGFNFFFINHIHHVNMIHSAIWLPAVLYCCRRGFRDNPDWFLVCPILLAFSLFGGHPQMTLYVFYTFSSYYFFQLYTERKYIVIRQSLYHFLLIVLLFALLSLVQILPTAEFLQNTERGILGYAGAVKDSLPLRSLLSVFIDGLFRETYESWQHWEFGCYLSIGAIMMILFSPWRGVKGETAFFGFLAALSLILSLGENTLLYKVFYTLVPGFKFFRVPARLIFLLSFSVSILASYGFYNLSRSQENILKNHKKIIFLILLIFFIFIPLLAIYFLDFPLNGHNKKLLARYAIISTSSFLSLLMIFIVKGRFQKLTITILLVVTVDLFLSRGLHNQVALNKDDMFKSLYQSPIAVVLRSEKEGTRFLAKNYYPLYANLGLVYRMSNIWGYNPFLLRLYSKLDIDSPRTASLLGAKFIDYRQIENLAEKWKGITVFKNIPNVFLNEIIMPRAIFVRKSLFAVDFDLQKSLNSGEFNPLEVVYLDRDFPSEKIEASLTTPSEYTVRHYENKGDEILIDIKNSTAGFLVLSEIYYPGWRVFVNGVEKEVLCANMSLRAVQLQAGENHVKLVFLPRTFVIGSSISAFTFLSIIIFFVISHQ